MSNAIQYADAHRADYLSQLKDLLRIPSISTLPEHAPDIRRCAEWIVNHLRQIGMTSVELVETPAHPIIYASWLGAPDKPTVLIYGHYDVQPVDPVSLWESAPFEPTERDGKLYARGATDDKGQLFAQIKAVDTLMKANNGTLPVNIKFLIEGEEEVGSQHLDDFILSHQDLLRADACVISDGTILAPDRPAICYSVRGLTYMELEVWGPQRDLHSGTYGGTVHNPLQALCEIIAQLHNPDGSINVPGFYDKVQMIDAAERAELAKTPWDENEWKHETGAPQPWGEAAYTLRERTGIRPTLEVHGLIGGFTGAGAKTVLPTSALAKISCRLVANQDPYEIEKLVRAQVERLTPPTVKSELRPISYGLSAAVPINDPAIIAAARAYERSFGKAPVFIREGGSLPVVATLRNVFNMPVVLMGFGLNSDNMHAPNEKFDLDLFYKGINTAIAMFEEMGKLEPAK